MSERRESYSVAQQPYARVPERWLRFLYRMAGLECGKMYTVTVIIPDKADCEPQWAISDGAKVENGR